MKASHLIIITGVSGSGKSLALKALEDMGFFCVDNLPAALITPFVDFLANLPQDDALPEMGDRTQERPAGYTPQCSTGEAGAGNISSAKFALLIDCRDRSAFPIVREAITKLRHLGTEVSILFLECQVEVIVRRFQESRRPHPLLISGLSLVSEIHCQSIPDALAAERELLAEFRAAANRIIDTTRLTPHSLREFIEEYLGYSRNLEVVLLSFGFKYGVPQDIDLLVDVRFLPNPHFVPELHDLTGLHRQVEDYVCQSPDAAAFLRHYGSLLQFLIPRYKREGKRYLTIGVGCTGGKHRSVAIAQKLASNIENLGVQMTVRHRDVERL